ncbi:MAG: FAD-binding oxidoreductase [Cyanosarcina radialis HA8281-LM2]|jgi:FAD/FMN-containing dehydrogenase/Fe-S oxidoreductase|nr:FAD-binding oxidoreductase [Cyanosarcina radialis HA8281-LM2]
MIPRLGLKESLKPNYSLFWEELGKSSFTGEIRADFASRLMMSTDNSIYQILPQAVVFPRTTADVTQLFQLANREEFQTITFAPRGGGTGTNGQSLSPGIIIDCSKYMNQILEVNLEEGWVRVQPGVVLDQLNAYLQPYGVFFAPSLAPSNRATIGGMINTDACGKGSRIYGRTSDRLVELTWVLPDGTIGRSRSIDLLTLDRLKQQPDRLGNIYRQVDEIVTSKQQLIEQTFPKMPRFLTGYNLAKVYSRSRDTFDLNRIIAGSEGTLAVITEAKLELTKIPKFKRLIVIHYACFDDALQATENLLQLEPAAIETIDEKILSLAKEDVIYQQVKEFIGDAKAINLVEFTGDSLEEIQEKIDIITNSIERSLGSTGYYLAEKVTEISNLWNLRKRGVGLLGNTPGERKPIPFIEDTAVPPSRLASYIKEFKDLLNSYQLDYAMFGHVDVGCLHVRPALDMKVPTDEALIRELSDRVVALVQKYGGVMWAEHGKGFRSEYTPAFFGEELYEDLRKIKAAFDPENKLNPGKIVTPAGSAAAVVRVEAPLRGHFDRQVPPSIRQEYAGAFNCNGNGACFNYNPDDVMCPSAKVTRDRIHSPKGRASLLREWWRQLGEGREERGDTGRGEGREDNLLTSHSTLHTPHLLKHSTLLKVWNTLGKYWGVYDYSHEVYEGMHGCLACKACATQCPVHVDIPEMKAKFLELYYTRYLRPGRDYLFGNIEAIANWQSYAPLLANAITQNPLTRWLVKRLLKMVDPPAVSQLTLRQGLATRTAPEFDLAKLSALSQTERENSVILLQDAFTSFYESQLFLDTYDFLRRLGYTVYVPPFFASGKPLHVKGFLKQFQAIAQKNAEFLSQLGSLNIPLLGIEPSIVLTYRDEYSKILNLKEPLWQVQLLSAFLVIRRDRLSELASFDRAEPYYLFSHCTEKTAVLETEKQWQQIFQFVGLKLIPIATGCCGMAGIYGHEAEHYDESKGIYQMSWQPHIRSTIEPKQYILATGYSCRSQIERFDRFTPLHPVQALRRSIGR